MSPPSPPPPPYSLRHLPHLHTPSVTSPASWSVVTSPADNPTATASPKSNGLFLFNTMLWLLALQELCPFQLLMMVFPICLEIIICRF
ncbi:hypothetical protein HanIR_Chr12g0573171 [Helianthus annuus]|nr:hypothetical protein HanIR_Chr12g0573171 [Helianthus annuus]